MLKTMSKVVLFILILNRIGWAADTAATPAATTSNEVQSTTENAPSKETTPPEAPAKEEKRQWRLGPAVSLSFPRVTEYSLEFKSGNGMFSTALTTGGFSFKPDSKTKAGFSNFELRGRWHPFMGTFFVGMGFGSQFIKVQATDSISSNNVTLDLDIASSYSLPHIGWLKVYDFGLTFGFDIGLIVPSGVKTKLTSNASDPIKATSDYKKLEDDAVSSGDKLGRVSLPYMTLFKVGWLF